VAEMTFARMLDSAHADRHLPSWEDEQNAEKEEKRMTVNGCA
jgi:hypothetical protein